MTALAFRPARRTRSVIRSAAVLVVAAVALLGIGRLGDLLPSLSNPFTSSTVDRSAPAVLLALDDLSSYQAATANYSLIVDVENDTRWVPSFIKGERTVLSARGNVDASVSFAGLNESSIVVDDKTNAVTITLPAATLGAPRIDMDESRVVSRNRGLVDRLGAVVAANPGNEQAMLATAQDKMAAAAAADDALLKRAEANTRAMLKSLLAPLGFDAVTVVFSG